MRKEVDNIQHVLGEWQGADLDSGFHRIKTKSGKVIKVAGLVEDDPAKVCHTRIAPETCFMLGKRCNVW